MSLAKVIEELKKSDFSCLVKEDKVLAVRAKIFDEPTREFQYFDFEVDKLNDENKKYIKSHMKGMRKEKLKPNGAGLLMTEAELKGTLVVQELTDMDKVNDLVGKIIKIKDVLCKE
jgi:hypothetical protein